jgi:hypothetical protein
MTLQPRRLPEARAIETPAPAGWRIAAMTALYLVSLGVVGVVAFVGAVRWYVAGFAHLPLWIGSGFLALIVGTYAAVWLARH